MDEFTNNGYLEKNLVQLHKYLVQDRNKDLTILVCGAPGNGKSALSWFIAEYLSTKIDTVGFDWETVAFTHNQWIQNEKKELDEKDISWYDEGYNTFYARNAMTNENKQGKSHLNQYRFKHHTRILNFQDIANIEKDLLYSNEIGVELLLRCVQQGWFHAYSQSKMQKIKIEKNQAGVKQIDWPEPDFKGSWPDPTKKFPEKWEKYEKTNREKIQEEDDEEEDKPILQCNKCGYNWKPMKDDPETIKKCPNQDCQTYKWND